MRLMLSRRAGRKALSSISALALTAVLVSAGSRGAFAETCVTGGTTTPVFNGINAANNVNALTGVSLNPLSTNTAITGPVLPFDPAPAGGGTVDGLPVYPGTFA